LAERYNLYSQNTILTNRIITGLAPISSLGHTYRSGRIPSGRLVQITLSQWRQKECPSSPQPRVFRSSAFCSVI